MKLRLRENSIRLRLLQSEVEQLRAGDSVAERIRFGDIQCLIYALEISNSAAEISARFENGKVTVVIPFEAARDWTETNLVGLESEQITGDGSPLKITIEKDFV